MSSRVRKWGKEAELWICVRQCSQGQLSRAGPCIKGTIYRPPLRLTVFPFLTALQLPPADPVSPDLCFTPFTSRNTYAITPSSSTMKAWSVCFLLSLCLVELLLLSASQYRKGANQTLLSRPVHGANPSVLRRARKKRHRRKSPSNSKVSQCRVFALARHSSDELCSDFLDDFFNFVQSLLGIPAELFGGLFGGNLFKVPQGLLSLRGQPEGGSVLRTTCRLTAAMGARRHSRAMF